MAEPVIDCPACTEKRTQVVVERLPVASYLALYLALLPDHLAQKEMGLCYFFVYSRRIQFFPPLQFAIDGTWVSRLLV